jgi:formylmethanofuran dehydrogenase subunit E
MRRNQFAIRKNTHEKESIKIKMKTELYCESCFENFTSDSIWNVYDLDGYPICEKCYDELAAFLN